MTFAFGRILEVNHLSMNTLMEVQTHLVFGLGLIATAYLIRRLGPSPSKENFSEKAIKESPLSTKRLEENYSFED